jgi:hypothetical protein
LDGNVATGTAPEAPIGRDRGERIPHHFLNEATAGKWGFMPRLEGTDLITELDSLPVVRFTFLATTKAMILVYLINQKLVFLENQYSEKGRRIGTLIEEWPGQWGFHAERGSGGLTALMLLAIAMELTRLNALHLAPKGPQGASQAPSGHTAPETHSSLL